MELSFIGLGGMGQAIAANLLKAGHSVTVWNRSPAPVEALQKLGANPAADVTGALQSEVMFSMLADDRALREVLLENGAILKARKGLIHVNMATISLSLALELDEIHKAQGLTYFAAPVFGRTEVAVAGKLLIAAAGAPEIFQKLEPLLAAVGQKTVFFGENPVSANVVKIAGNFMIASAIETMGEAASLVRGHGIAAGDFLRVLTGSLFAAPVFQTYGAIISEERYEPAAFKLSLGLKDVRLALAAGDAANVPLPLASLLRDNFLEAVAHGDSGKDWSALAAVSSRRAGLS